MSYPWYPHGQHVVPPLHSLPDVDDNNASDRSNPSYHAGSQQHTYGSSPWYGLPALPASGSSKWPQPVSLITSHNQSAAYWNSPVPGYGYGYPLHPHGHHPGFGYAGTYRGIPGPVPAIESAASDYNHVYGDSATSAESLGIARSLSAEIAYEDVKRPGDQSRTGTKTEQTPNVFHDLDKERNRDSSFLHPPIDFTRRQIRLIRVLPTRPGKPIKCKFALSMVDDKSIRYTALSYTWGNASKESDVVRIVLHKQDFWVRRNLWCFLRQIRDDPSLRGNWYWIDALCIDQAENGDNGHQEKNHQVNMVSRIYRNAHEVIAWLGEPAKDDGVALEALDNYVQTGVSENEDLICDGLRFLGDSQYWLRIWIIQELVLARDVLFRSGIFNFHWDQLYAIRLDMDRCRHRCPSDMGWAMINVLDLRHDWSRGESLGMLATLSDFRSQRCSDPRDKVYGFLGLMAMKPCKADYSKTCQELYEDIVLWSLKHKVFEPPYNSTGNAVGGSPCNSEMGRPMVCQFLDIWRDRLGVTLSEMQVAHSRIAAAIREEWPLFHPFASSCCFNFKLGRPWRVH